MSADLAVGVSIVTFRSDLAQLERTIAGLAAQTLPTGRLAVHVNEATDAEVASIGALLPAEAVLTRSADNRGFAGAHNAMIEAHLLAGMTHVLVLNPDLVLAPEAVAELVAASRLHPGSLVGPLLVLADPATGQSEERIDTVGIVWTASGRHRDARQGEPLKALPVEPVAVDGVSGACLFVDRAAYDQVVDGSGEFFDETFLAYREDAELCFRANLLGVASWLAPAARGLHARNLRGTTRTASEHVNRLGVRNRFLITAKYGRARPGSGLSPWLRDAVVLGGVVVRERSSWSGVVDAWRLRSTMRAKGRRVLGAARRP